MQPFNIFGVEQNDFKFMLDIAGVPIYVNGVPKRAIINNTRYLKEFNDKYISTDFNMQRGDIVYYDNKYWMITTQVGSPRHESYKGMRQIEHDIIFNLKYIQGEPAPAKYLLKCPAIVQQTADFVAEYSRMTQAITVTSEIHVFVQDNPKTRKIMKLPQNSAIGHYGVVFGNREYDIVGVSTVNKVVLDITLRLGSLGEYTDTENEIVWKDPPPVNWQNFIDDSMYDLQDGTETPPPPVILPDANINTIVGVITGTVTVPTSGMSDGKLLVQWSTDANASTYTGLAGYKLVLYKDTFWSYDPVQTVEVNASTLQYEFTNLSTGSYYIEIQAKYSDGADTVYLRPQTSNYYTL